MKSIFMITEIAFVMEILIKVIREGDEGVGKRYNAVILHKDGIVPTEPTPLQTVSREGSAGVWLQGVHKNQLVVVSSSQLKMK